MQEDTTQALLGCPLTLVYHFSNPNVHVAKAGFKHFFFHKRKNQNIIAYGKTIVHWNEHWNKEWKKKTGYQSNKTEIRRCSSKAAARSRVLSGWHTSFIFHRCWRRSTIVFTTSIQGTHARAISTNKTWIPIYGFKNREVSIGGSFAAVVRRWFFADESLGACEETLLLEYRKSTDSLLWLTKCFERFWNHFLEFFLLSFFTVSKKRKSFQSFTETNCSLIMSCRYIAKNVSLKNV